MSESEPYVEDRIEQLEDELQTLESRLEWLNNSPEEYVEERKQELDGSLKQVQTGYEPEISGNETMYQHLRGLLQEIGSEEKDGVPHDNMKVVTNRRSELRERKDRLSKRIAELEEEADAD